MQSANQDGDQKDKKKKKKGLSGLFKPDDDG
jgi:hypothetical protein